MSDVGSQVSIGASQTTSQVSIGASQTTPYRQNGPGSDFSSTYNPGPRNPQPQDYSMSMQAQTSSQASVAYQPAHLQVGSHQTYVDDGMSSFSGGGSDFYPGGMANNSTFHHGPGSTVGGMSYTNGSGDGQSYSGVSTPVPPQQQQQQQMQLLSQHQNTNGYGGHGQYQSQTPQPNPSQGNYSQFADPGPAPPRGWTAEDTSGSQVNGSNLWNAPGPEAYNFGGSIA